MIRSCTFIQNPRFRRDNGLPLKLSDGIGEMDPSVENGHHQPFLEHVKEGETFTLFTKFKVCPLLHYRDAIA